MMESLWVAPGTAQLRGQFDRYDSFMAGPNSNFDRTAGPLRVTQLGLTFDDVLLVPAQSDLLPHQANTATKIGKNIKLGIPLVSAAMDSVTESALAIGLARLGGIGILHRNMSIEDQAAHINQVKRSQAGMITDPITLGQDALVSEAEAMMNRYKISGVPITEPDGTLVGLVTNRDLRFVTDYSQPLRDVMRPLPLVTVEPGTTIDQAREVLKEHRIEKLPVVDAAGKLTGLITIKDIKKRDEYPNATLDAQNRLMVGAAVGTGPDTFDRVDALVSEGVDLIVVDTAHGHSSSVISVVEKIAGLATVDVVAGNIATADAVRALADAGASAVKVGVGPGSICTTRIVAGVGVPQLTAIADCAEVAAERGLSVIADGGIRLSGDIPKAIAAGADAVMIGSILGGVDESPGEVVYYNGERFKEYRAMGSVAAMAVRSSYSKDRYFQGDVVEDEKLVPEGVEARVPYRGPMANVIHQLVGGLRAAMGYCGTGTIEELKKNATFVQISDAGRRESHPHDVIITKEAPNYLPSASY